MTGHKSSTLPDGVSHAEEELLIFCSEPIDLVEATRVLVLT